jgi:hypothetical protein
MLEDRRNEDDSSFTPEQRERIEQLFEQALEEGVNAVTAESIRQLAEAFGEEWLTQVRHLPPAFQPIAVAAGLARIDASPGWFWSEQNWLAVARDSPSLLVRAMTLPDRPHADVDNLFEQAVLILKDKRLWPWMLSPQGSRD